MTSEEAAEPPSSSRKRRSPPWEDPEAPPLTRTASRSSSTMRSSLHFLGSRRERSFRKLGFETIIVRSEEMFSGHYKASVPT